MTKKVSDKIVYIAMSADIIHRGHLNIIDKAKKYGKVILGLLTDPAIASYKRVPLMNFDERKAIVNSIKGIEKVISQNSLDYVPNLLKLKPDFVLHGDDWKQGVQKETRNKVILVLKKWGGKLIEIPYTKGISSTKLIQLHKSLGTTPDIRRNQLKRLLNSKKYLRFLDIHNGLSALIIEKIKITKNNKEQEFDGMWASSLTNSTAKGKPDIEAVDSSERMQLLNEVLEVTTKPIIYDGDTGGKTEHFIFMVKNLERLGVSAVIIEDKVGLKKNSLFGNEVFQQQDTIKNFCNKISTGKKNQSTDDFMIIARIESLILNKSYKDALVRAKAYIKAGADGIMIHSKEKNPKDLIKFCKFYNKFKNRKPLVIVPTSFSHMTEKKINNLGADIIIYANHLLRSAYPNMLKTAVSILKFSRAKEAEKSMMSIKEILNLIPITK
jgi:phosphoenolpyruvate phosphomutase